MLSLFSASCASLAQRFTTSPAVLARWSELTSAPLDTGAFRSTMHCFIIVLSVMLHRARMAGARYRSSLPVMSFVSELVTMITSSAIGLSSLMPRYTMRRITTSFDWNSFVIAKKHSVASRVPSTSPSLREETADLRADASVACCRFDEGFGVFAALPTTAPPWFAADRLL
uniref:Uncharacterized protein n=1 Tax=Anopheles merus TaxID=30066 RepID=A0A182V1U4_ANOME